MAFFRRPNEVVVGNIQPRQQGSKFRAYFIAKLLGRHALPLGAGLNFLAVLVDPS